MAKPFDATTKALVESYPADWLRWLGWPAGQAELIDADLATVTPAADKVMRVTAPERWLLDLELQSSYKLEVPGRLHWYNTLLRQRHGLPVRSVVVLLRPEADGPAMSGAYQEAFAGEEPYLVFRYRVIRLWQVPDAHLVAGGLGTLPLAPLGDVAPADLPGVIRQMRDRLDREAPRERAEALWTASLVLMGLRYDEAVIDQLMRGVAGMEESVTYQAIVRKGGLREAHAILLRQGRKRFGPPEPDITAAVEAITDLDRLERLSERLLDVSSWQDLLAGP
jgi:predicted transposase YdaD